MIRIGQSQTRFEDDGLLRGAGLYTDDLDVAGALHAAFVRSDHAAGRIVAIDISAAAEMPGVHAVLTGEEMAADGVAGFEPRVRHPGPDGGPMPVPPFPPLAVGRVRYVGDPVAVVLAADRATAEIAADAVAVEIEPAPAVVDAEAAAAEGAPRVWEEIPGNLCFRVEKGDGAAVEAALGRAAHVVRERIAISRVTAAALEPRAVVARHEPETGRYRLELGTQSPHRMRPDLAQALGIEPEAIRITSHACGGGFGTKNVAYPEYAALLWAARRAGMAVRWRAGRGESFAADAHAREQWAEAALALDEDGNFLALDVAIRASLGAYLGPATPHPPVANIGGLAGVYRTPAMRVSVEGYFTNTQNVSPYRGAGRPEASYILERMIDRAARATGADRVELRRRNLVRPGQMPYRTPLTFTYDCGDFPAVLDRAVAAADWEGLPARRAASRARGLLRGAGVVAPIEIAGGPATGPNPEFAALSAAPDGRVELRAGSSDSGQGHLTAFRQILSDRLGLDPAVIAVRTGDTETVARGFGSFGSRTAMAAGTSIWRAADRVIAALAADAADELEVAAADLEFAHGRWTVAGTDRSVGFTEILARRDAPVVADAWETVEAPTFPNGAHVCEVEVDPETGAVRVDRYTVVDDVGTVINPLLLKGQIAGGVAQGLGQALMEALVYEAGTGQLLGASFMDYAMPRAGDLPFVAVESHPVPTATNPLGVKGAGEAGTVGALPAVMNAVNDALSEAGAGPVDMPATPARVWQALARARDARA